MAVAQLRAGGPAGLSLRAIATDLGLTPTAIWWECPRPDPGRTTADTRPARGAPGERV